MCKPASFIVTRDKVLWLRHSDRHEDIIAEFKLNDRGVCPDFVRIEITPPCNDFRRPFLEWQFRVDQDRLPEWWSAEWAEGETRRVLPEWFAARCITEDCDVAGGVHFVLKGTPSITMQNGSGWVQTRDTSTPSITMQNGSGWVQTCDTSKPSITMQNGSGWVQTRDTSKPSITMQNGSGGVQTRGVETLESLKIKRQTTRMENQ